MRFISTIILSLSLLAGLYLAGQQIGQVNPERLYIQGMSGLKMKLSILKSHILL